MIAKQWQRIVVAYDLHVCRVAAPLTRINDREQEEFMKLFVDLLRDYASRFHLIQIFLYARRRKQSCASQP
jgi:hypothetical protein